MVIAQRKGPVKGQFDFTDISITLILIMTHHWLDNQQHWNIIKWNKWEREDVMTWMVTVFVYVVDLIDLWTDGQCVASTLLARRRNRIWSPTQVQKTTWTSGLSTMSFGFVSPTLMAVMSAARLVKVSLVCS